MQKRIKQSNAYSLTVNHSPLKPFVFEWGTEKGKYDRTIRVYAGNKAAAIIAAETKIAGQLGHGMAFHLGENIPI